MHSCLSQLGDGNSPQIGENLKDACIGSSCSSFYNAVDLQLEDGDIEYLTGVEVLPREDVSLAAMPADDERKHGEQSTAAGWNTERRAVVIPEHTGLPRVPSRVQIWLDAHDAELFEDPDLAGPFPAGLHALPRCISSLPSFSGHPECLPRPQTGFIPQPGPPLSEDIITLIPNHGPSPEVNPMNTNKRILRQRKRGSLDSNRGRQPSPTHGSLISGSPGRTRSLSPRKHLNRQSVHINMNLTESQMDKITDAFSSHVGSPTDIRASNAGGRSSRTTQSSSTSGAKYTENTHRTAKAQPRSPDDLTSFGDAEEGEYGSPRWRLVAKRRSPFNTMPDGYPSEQVAPPKAATLAQRRQQQSPPYVDVGENRKYGTFIHRSSKFPVSSHPLQYGIISMGLPDDDISSIYSQDMVNPATNSPYIRGNTVSQKIDSVAQSYNGWNVLGDSSLPSERIASPGRGQIRESSPHRQADVAASTGALRQPEAITTTYSPLTTYFAFEGLPVQKKILVGDQGWLDRPHTKHSNPRDHSKELSPKKPGLLESIKKMAKDMTENKSSRRPRESEKSQKAPKMTISLDPREQSLLYCELEFHVSNALHMYITNELNHGRLDANKLKKIADNWGHKGRPKVVGFRYDLETQLSLIDLHIEDFRFFGRRQSNPVEISGLLHAMKVNSRAMRIRTFCQPDSVIAKQLVDSQSLFNTIGCSDAQQVSLAEIAQFFKVIVEREKLYRDRLSRAADEAEQSFRAGEVHPGERWDPQPEADFAPHGAFEVYGSITKGDTAQE